MKTEDEIKTKIAQYVKMLDYEENQNDVMQVKLYAYIDILSWIIRG